VTIGNNERLDSELDAINNRRSLGTKSSDSDNNLKRKAHVRLGLEAVLRGTRFADKQAQPGSR
jgi:hypothetical protein